LLRETYKRSEQLHKNMNKMRRHILRQDMQTQEGGSKNFSRILSVHCLDSKILGQMRRVKSIFVEQPNESSTT